MLQRLQAAFKETRFHIWQQPDLNQSGLFCPQVVIWIKQNSSRTRLNLREQGARDWTGGKLLLFSSILQSWDAVIIGVLKHDCLFSGGPHGLTVDMICTVNATRRSGSQPYPIYVNRYVSDAIFLYLSSEISCSTAFVCIRWIYWVRGKQQFIQL